MQLDMIKGYDPDLINPASLDVRLGNHLMVESLSEDKMVEVDISSRTKESPYLLNPREFCLAETVEIFNIPDWIAGQFVLKSSRAREGYENLLAGWIDPGFNGSRLTLELVNAKQYWAIPLYPNLKIGQIVFFKMGSIPEESYEVTGRYNGDLKVKDSRG